MPITGQMTSIRDRSGGSSLLAAERAEGDLQRTLPAVMAVAIVALGLAQLADGLVLGAITTAPHALRPIVGRAIRLTLISAPMLLLALADVRQLRVLAPLNLWGIVGAAAAAVAFEAVYRSFGEGLPSPLLALPLLLLVLVGALAGARVTALRAFGQPAHGASDSGLWESAP